MTEEQRKLNREFLRDLEEVELAAWSDFHRAAAGDIAGAGGIGLIPDVKVCAAVASKIDVLAFNRVLGLGLDKVVDASEIAALVAEYQKRGVPRFFVQLHPQAAETGVDKTLEAAGFAHYNNWIKLYRSVEPAVKAKSDLEIREITKTEASRFGRIVVESFEWPALLMPWIAASVGRPNWRHYMAYHDDRAVATAAFFQHGEYAWIDFAATLADYRGRGAQSALLARRVQDARQAGCRWLVVETAEQTKHHEAPSYRNMIRYGFAVGYVRPNYLIKLT